MELVIYRIHSLPKPQHLPNSIAREVIHFNHFKNQLIQKERILGTLPDLYAHLNSTIRRFITIYSSTPQTFEHCYKSLMEP